MKALLSTSSVTLCTLRTRGKNKESQEEMILRQSPLIGSAKKLENTKDKTVKKQVVCEEYL
jgi:hypothetical protein